MLKAKVGYSTNIDSYIAGTEASKMISKELNPKFSFVYTSEKNNIKEVINSLQENIKTPFIGCTSHNGIIVEDGIDEAPVLPMCIQPLVENSFKYGFQKKVDGEWVRRAVEQDIQIDFAVTQ